MMIGKAPVRDPSVKEIIQHLDSPTLSDVSEDGIKHWRRNLKHICETLRDFPATSGAHLVTQTYYDEYRTHGPLKAEEAKECVCTGELPFGIRIPGTTGSDLIRIADLTKNLKAANGKISCQSDRGLTSVQRNEVSVEELLEVYESMREVFEFVLPVQRELKALGIQPDAPLFSNQGGDGAQALPE